jgi:hypothetical protein
MADLGCRQPLERLLSPDDERLELADQRQTLRRAVGYAAMHCASVNLTDP